MPRERSLLTCLAGATACLVATGCARAHQAAPGIQPAVSSLSALGAAFPTSLVDARGHTIRLQRRPARIVSLAPSDTEILFALGAQDQIAGDTTACDFPPAARAKPHVGGYPIATERILALNPDLVVAVGSIDSQPIQALDRSGITTLVVDPKTVAQTYEAIQLLGKATGHLARADQIVKSMRARITALSKRTARARFRPKVLIAYSVNPIYTTGPGSFIDDLIRIAGGRNIVSAPLTGNMVSPETVLVQQPDVIICGADLIPKLRRVPGWASGVPAVRHNRFFTTSPPGILERPGPRIVDGAAELARFLHPEIMTNRTNDAPRRDGPSSSAR